MSGGICLDSWLGRMIFSCPMEDVKRWQSLNKQSRERSGIRSDPTGFYMGRIGLWSQWHLIVISSLKQSPPITMNWYLRKTHGSCFEPERSQAVGQTTAAIRWRIAINKIP